MSEQSDTGYTDRQRAALGATPGICRSLNDERTFMCDLDEGHEGYHSGFELPTITLDEPTRPPGPCVEPECYCRCTWQHDGFCPACLHVVSRPGATA